MQSSYLVHHGIKGQKWGVRRFQNEDGSLTEAGQKRYSEKKSISKYEYRKVADKLGRRVNGTGIEHTKYAYNKAHADNKKISGKEHFREYSRNLYKTDAQYKKLYDEHAIALADYDKFVQKYSNTGAKFIDYFLGTWK